MVKQKRGTRRTEGNQEDQAAIDKLPAATEFESVPMTEEGSQADGQTEPQAASLDESSDTADSVAEMPFVTLEDGTRIGKVSVEIPFAIDVTGYAQQRPQVSLTDEQARALKAVRFALAEMKERTKTQGAYHRDGKVVDSTSDAIKYILDQVAVQIAAVLAG